MRRNFAGLWLFALLLLMSSASASLASDRCVPAGGRLRISCSDKGSGRIPVLFVHGWSCDRTFWSRQIEGLSRSRRVIAMDLPGHGGNDAPDIAYTQELFADSVGRVLDHLRIRRAVLVGHSMGWNAIRTFALRHPERVAALVNVDGAFFRVPETPEDQANLSKLFAQFGKPFETRDREAFESLRRGFIASCFAPETPQALREWILGRVSATPQYVSRSSILDFLRVERWTDARPVTTPTLAIYAKFTARRELPGHEEYLRRLCPNLEYEEWPSVGHFLMQEDAERLNQRLLVFLDTIR